MASQTELTCTICHEIFRDPVILSCDHSFCEACWQRWCIENPSHECPLCRRSSNCYPPLNMELKNRCEAYLNGEAAHSLHALSQQPEASTIGCTNEADLDYSDRNEDLLKPLQEKLELFKDFKGNFEQIAANIEVQTKETERQIRDVYLMLRRFLKKEELARIAAVREEQKQKTKMVKKKIETLSRDITALSDTITTTEDVLRAADVSHQHRYNIAAEIAHYSLPDDPQPMSGAAIDMTQHLNNLAFNMLENVKRKVASANRNPRTSNPEPGAASIEENMSRLRVGERLRSVSELAEAFRASDTSQNRELFSGVNSEPRVASIEENMSRLRVGERLRSVSELAEAFRASDTSQNRELFYGVNSEPRVASIEENMSRLRVGERLRSVSELAEAFRASDTSQNRELFYGVNSDSDTEI